MPAPGDQDLTQILSRVNAGARGAADELLERIFAELRRIAARHMDGQPAGHTLQPSALVNEAYLRLFRGVHHDFRDRRHFLALASRAMRSVLVDRARAKARDKRQPGGSRLPLDDLEVCFEERSGGLLALDQALAKLAGIDARMMELVELRFFGGRTLPQAAEVLGISIRTAERDWTTARAWLRRELV